MGDEADLREAVTYLQQTSAGGRSLYDHLADVLLNMLEQRPTNPLDTFESFSFNVKSEHTTPEPSGVKVCFENVSFFGFNFFSSSGGANTRA